MMGNDHFLTTNSSLIFMLISTAHKVKINKERDTPKSDVTHIRFGQYNEINSRNEVLKSSWWLLSC